MGKTLLGSRVEFDDFVVACLNKGRVGGSGGVFDGAGGRGAFPSALDENTGVIRAGRICHGG